MFQSRMVQLGLFDIRFTSPLVYVDYLTVIENSHHCVAHPLTIPWTQGKHILPQDDGCIIVLSLGLQPHATTRGKPGTRDTRS